MSLSDVSIQRPVLATVMSLVITLFGVVGFAFLGVREYPAVDPPVITVETRYPGAHPEVIASQITEPLEQQINGIEGIRDVSSTSSEERSQIRVEFAIDVDLEAAANDVRDKVAQAIRNLPQDADPPVVQKADADAEPILFLTAQSAKRDILAVNDLADRVVKERLQTIPGVSSIRIFGEKKIAMRLWMDPAKLAAHRLTPLDVQAALEAQNVDLPSGRLEGSTVDLALRTRGRLTTPAEFEALVLGVANGRQILLRDIGRAELGPENLRTGNKVNLLPAVTMALVPQPNTNAIAIADEFYRRLDSIRAELPEDVELTVRYDFTKFVRRSITEVEETVLFSFVLVATIIYAFLRSWRSTVIPLVAIPVSIIATFFVMYLAGFTINVLTLVGLVLAIGMVVDDAIVVLENIYAKIEAGRSPREAAVEGAREIYFAVISTTLALAAVFVPVIFLEGLSGRLFREFGVVLVGAVLVSAFVSLTLTPMMCSRLLRRETRHGVVHRWTEPFFVWLTSGYARTLEAFMAARWIALAILPVLAAAIAVLFWSLPKELAPLEDRSILRVSVRAPEGASYDFMQHQLDKIGVYLQDEIPEVGAALSIVGAGGLGVNSGRYILFLEDPDERERSQDEVTQQFSRDAGRFTGVRLTPSQPPTIGDRRSNAPVQFVLQAPTLDILIGALPEFLAEAEKSPVLRFVDVDLKIDRPEGSIAIDRRKAADLGISALDIARTLQLAYGGVRFDFFLREGRQYQVIGQVERDDRNDPGDLHTLYMRGSGGELVSLDNLVEFSETASSSAVYRFNRFTSATVSANLAEGHTIGDGIAALEEVAARVLPPSMRTSLTGQARDFVESASSLLFAFALALLVVYLLLAAQFESFVDPFIILATVPLSLVGALASLALFGQTLNIFSQIGMIMLIGLVTKNGILIVEFANQRREAGQERTQAVIDAARSRFRPVLMTSLSTILGILPIALALGGAAGSRRPLGLAVVGGLVFSTALTLYVVPAIYTYLSRSQRSEIRETAPVPRTSAA